MQVKKSIEFIFPDDDGEEGDTGEKPGNEEADSVMEYQDIQLKCVTCGREFIFTAKEQEFFQSKGFREPRHCRECRQRRKQERERLYAEASGQPYQPGRELFTVTCAQCGRETKVPFKPITGKPVLCKDCFIAQRYGSKPIEATEVTETKVESPPPAEPPRPSAEQEAIPVGAPEIDLSSVSKSKEEQTAPKEDTAPAEPPAERPETEAEEVTEPAPEEAEKNAESKPAKPTEAEEATESTTPEKPVSSGKEAPEDVTSEGVKPSQTAETDKTEEDETSSGK